MSVPDASAPLSPPQRAVPLPIAMQELGRRLVSQGLLTRNQLEDVLSRAALLGQELDQILTGEGLIPEDHILELLAEISRIPLRPIAQFTITQEIAHKVSAHTALHYRIIPVEFADGAMTIAASRLHDGAEQESLQMLTGGTVRWVLCKRSDIDEAIKHFYGIGADLVGDLGAARAKAVETDGVAAETEGPGVAKLISEIIHEAILMNASDIHIEPYEGRLALRYRVDGVLCRIPLPEDSHRLTRSIVSHIKVLAQLNITERRLPQDGRISTTFGDEKFDIRVSILPTQHGESVNMRILNRKTTFLNLQQLGILPHQMPPLERLMSLSHGLVLITGPTGSGKTTMLYAQLARIRTDNISVVTIEDPVEYQMDGILQIQTHADVGLDFATGLRSVLRHDPNVILIGEIRDTETADIAIKSSLTGHLVFSTLHTNDSTGAVARLVDMGIEPYLVASSLEGVVAQRLLRRVCPSCKEPARVPEPILQEIDQVLPGRVAAATFLQGRGCPDCKYTGYKGRCGIFEILSVSDALRLMVVQGESSDAIRKHAVQEGMEPLRVNGWRIAMDGGTSVSEVLRVTHAERL